MDSFGTIALLAALEIILTVTLWQYWAHERLKKQDEERNMMVALLSHRLRTPLTSMKWHLEMLLDSNFGKLQIAQLELINQLRGSIDDAISTLNTFLATARIEQGNSVLKPISIDMWNAVKTILASMQPEIDRKHLTIETVTGTGRSMAFMDQFMLNMILEVLIQNAITYTPENGTITLSCEEHPKYVTFVIRDTGIGIAQQEQTQLFTKFFRGAEARNVDTSGNGLGLYLVKEVLTQVGGSIRCESTAGKGTTFFVELPKEKVA